MSDKVRVKGVRELQASLKRVDADLPREMKVGFKEVATRIADKIRPKVARKTGRAASSVTARATQRGGAIAAGGTKAPYFPWLDFGGSVGRGHRPRKAWSGAIVREWKGNPDGEGRYIYPTIGENRALIREEVEDFMVHLARKRDFKVKTGL